MKRTPVLVLLTLFCLAAVDLSTPKEAAKSLYRAVDAGDAPGIAQVLDVPTPEHQPLVTALADLLVATKKMGDAAKAKFGQAGEKLGSGTMIPEDLKQLDSAKVEEKDGVAIITIPNQLAPLKFHSRQNQWKLDISDYYDAHSNLASQTKLVQNFSEQLKLVTEEITAGRFGTPIEAETAIKQRFNEVMIKSVNPSSQPTTAPAR